MKFSAKQHVLFWSGYITWDILQTVFSLLSSGGKLSDILLKVVPSSLLIAIPKIILFYFIYYFVLVPVVAKRQKAFLPVIYSILAVTIILLLYRMMMFYFILPVLFGFDMSSARFFNLSSLVITLFELLIPVFLLIIYELYRYTKFSRERERKLEKEKLTSELNFLKAQINPHFLFNVLSTIHALSRTKAPEAADVTMKLSRLIRFMLFDTTRKTITISEEIKILENYIELEQVRFSNKLKVKFKKNIDNDAQQVAPLILLPFVENAFKHGSGESRFNSFVVITLSVNEGILEFSVENSFEESSTRIETTRIGLANIKRQLELLYPEHKLTLEKKDNTFIASLKFKLQGNEDV
jgi:sensor histidine kinase YesM